MIHFILEQTETVTIKSKNFPTHSFGVRNNPNELYISDGNNILFHVEVPGLSGDSDSASFKSIGEGKYVFEENGLLYLKSLSVEATPALKQQATFKISKDKFSNVSNVCTFCF